MPSIDVEVEIEEVDFDEVDEIDDLEQLDHEVPPPRDDTRTFLQDLPRFAEFAAEAAAVAPPQAEAPRTGAVSLGDLRGMMLGEPEEPAAPSVEFGEVETSADDPFATDPFAEDDFPTDRPSQDPFAEQGPGSPELGVANDFGELDFVEEAPTSRRSVGPDGPRITPPTYHDATGGMDLDLSSPAEVAMSRRSVQLDSEHDDIEQELGVNLSLDVHRPPLGSAPKISPAQAVAERPVGMASVRPSRPPGAPDRIAHSGPEPFAQAPSATLPPVEPPSRPSQAPSPRSMREPSPLSSAKPAPRASLDDVPSGAIPSAPPLPRIDTSHIKDEERPPSMRVRGTVVDGLDLLDVPGLQDLPEEALAILLASVVITRLERGVEAASFGVALVTHGAVQLMPTIADAACALARKGEVIFTQGTLATGIELRVVGFDPGSRVALFSRQALERATADCPWVADDLAAVADKYQALAGAVMGPLGDSLDDMFRGMVLEKLSVKRPKPGDAVATAGKALDGLYIVGAGSVDILGPDGAVTDSLGAGDFLFPETLLGGSPAPRSARVGDKGALLLYATRMSAHELLATCPPFIELLAG
jgi:hypothetical protein